MESSVINEELTLAEGAILPWKDARFYTQILEEMCQKKKIPFHIPYKNLTRKQKDMILYGVEDERFQAVFSSGRDDERVYMAKYEGVITKLERQYLDSAGKTDTYVKNLTKFTTEQVCRSCQ